MFVDHHACNMLTSAEKSKISQIGLFAKKNIFFVKQETHCMQLDISWESRT